MADVSFGNLEQLTSFARRCAHDTGSYDVAQELSAEPLCKIAR